MTHEVTREASTTASTDGALMVDARETDGYAAGQVPGAWSMPLHTAPARYGELSAVADGAGAWARDGRPLPAGSHRPAA